MNSNDKLIKRIECNTVYFSGYEECAEKILDGLNSDFNPTLLKAVVNIIQICSVMQIHQNQSLNTTLITEATHCIRKLKSNNQWADSQEIYVSKICLSYFCFQKPSEKEFIEFWKELNS